MHESRTIGSHPPQGKSPRARAEAWRGASDERRVAVFIELLERMEAVRLGERHGRGWYKPPLNYPRIDRMRHD